MEMTLTRFFGSKHNRLSAAAYPAAWSSTNDEGKQIRGERAKSSILSALPDRKTRDDACWGTFEELDTDHRVNCLLGETRPQIL